ncbi:MAG: diguanylate cyclase [Desulfobulbales bacterium]|nr:diguanylate cyclase [Desulfobulbales bacterium]
MAIISLIITVLISAIFGGFNHRHSGLIREHLAHEARAFFNEIVQTRQWIINQDGVYVKKKPGMRTDPFLAGIAGLKTAITDGQGETYLLRNHAAITKMISAMATEERLFGISITSLNPLNPLNEPDAFEHAALLAFEKGKKEIHRFEKTPGGVLFRYMAPLPTRKECLKCHFDQGLEPGAIRGGISISIPADQVVNEVNETRIYILVSGVLLLGLLLSVIIYLARRLLTVLDEDERKLVKLAGTDPLTDLFNRREGNRRFKEEISHSVRERLPLSIIIIDIDLFKQINDNFGHQAGDEAIIKIADTMKATLRDYDTICRYGGEEFLVILPTTELAKALEAAERLRRVIEAEVILTGNDKKIRLTISCGVASLREDDTIDSLLYRADNALYIAKEEGRNQVRHLENRL